MRRHATDDDVVKAIRNVYKTAKPSPDFKERLYHRLLTEVEPGQTGPPTSSDDGFWGWMAVVTGAASALTLVIALLVIGAL